MAALLNPCAAADCCALVLSSTRLQSLCLVPLEQQLSRLWVDSCLRYVCMSCSAPCAQQLAMLIPFSFFGQMACGAVFGIVPFLSHRRSGLTVGVVAAGGNVGAAAMQVRGVPPAGLILRQLTLASHACRPCRPNPACCSHAGCWLPVA
jgi:nitrate/nitrite transporter NarK